MAGLKVKKKELLERIETAHRQLERYIFYYEKSEHGEFHASTQPKFSRGEMAAPGIHGVWSLKDLLAFVVSCENFTAALLTRQRSNLAEVIPKPGGGWASEISADQIPQDVLTTDLDETLSAFPDSYEGLYARVKSRSEEELFESHVYEWSGEFTAADYVGILTVDLYDWTKGMVRKWRKRHAGETLNKQVILERIRTERRRLDGHLDTLPRQDMEVSNVVGEWSVKDLLAHLMEWERMFTAWYEAGLRGERPEIPAPGYTWSEMDALNEHIYQKHRERPLVQVLVDFKDSYQKVYNLVESIPEDVMFSSNIFEWVGKGSLVTYILANTANHYRWAKEKVRAWLKIREEN